jgi:hypothetical protein
MSDTLITTVGYFMVSILSLVIAGRIKKHLNVNYSLIIHVLIIAVAFYYLVDVLLIGRPFDDPYFVLWIAVILTQIIMLVWRGKNLFIKGGD